MARIADYLEQMRPKQWFKSLYIAIGAAPAILLTPPLPLLIIPLLAYGIVNMILLQGVMYVVNDVADIENDRNHPEKSKRPIASGRIGPSAAYAFALSLFVIATVSAFFIDKRIVIIDFILFGLAMAYSLRPLRLRDRAYWDVGIAAINFPLRVAVGWFLFEPYNIARLTLGMQFEGTSIAGETISKLLFGLSPQAIDMTVRFSTVTLSFAGMIAATYLLAVFLLSMKRLGELSSLRGATVMRASLVGWSEARLKVIAIISALLFVAFALLFAISLKPLLLLVIPLVAYGIYWYYRLSTTHPEIVRKPELVLGMRKAQLMAALTIVLSLILLLYRG